jgi:hypothetical protein
MGWAAMVGVSSALKSVEILFCEWW